MPARAWARFVDYFLYSLPLIVRAFGSNPNPHPNPNPYPKPNSNPSPSPSPEQVCAFGATGAAVSMLLCAISPHISLCLPISPYISLCLDAAVRHRPTITARVRASPLPLPLTLAP